MEGKAESRKKLRAGEVEAGVTPQGMPDGR